MAANANIVWIAVDWGTSNLRVWMIGLGGQVVANAHSDQGMGVLARDDFEGALLDLIAPHLTSTQVMPVICCGMVGSRQGWAEAPYQAAPCAPLAGQGATRIDTLDPRICVFILPGIKQRSPADVMRGEETQIAGFLRDTPDFDGVLCLPGTHAKWVHISAGEIVSFQTFMTGEMFALLADQSVLRHSVTSDGFDADAFTAALDDAMTRPQMVAAHLFGLRAGSLVSDLAPAAARARLSGLLIGIELAAARPYWLGRDVAIIGGGALAALYRNALAAQGLKASQHDVTDMTLLGLTAAHQSLIGAST